MKLEVLSAAVLLKKKAGYPRGAEPSAPHVLIKLVGTQNVNACLRSTFPAASRTPLRRRGTES